MRCLTFMNKSISTKWKEIERRRELRGNSIINLFFIPLHLIFFFFPSLSLSLLKAFIHQAAFTVPRPVFVWPGSFPSLNDKHLWFRAYLLPGTASFVCPRVSYFTVGKEVSFFSFFFMGKRRQTVCASLEKYEIRRIR